VGARGIYQAQECHFVNLIPPVDGDGGITSGVINLKDYAHATIVLQLGVSATPGKVSLEASDNGSPEATAAIGFNVHKCEVAYNAADGDVLGPRVACAAADGFTPVTGDGIFYVIELDSNTLPSGKPYVKLVLADPGATLGSALAILSGARYGHDQSESVLV